MEILVLQQLTYPGSSEIVPLKDTPLYLLVSASMLNKDKEKELTCH